MTRTRVALPLFLALLSCSGAKVNVLDDGGSSGGPGGDDSGTPGSLPDTGLPPLSCGATSVTSIAGTWDLIASTTGGDQQAAVLTIDPHTFSFAASGKSLTFSAPTETSTSLTWRDNGKTVPIQAEHPLAPFDQGVVPLVLGGQQWSFASTSDGENCIGSLGSTNFDATCSQVRGTPFGTLNGTLVGTRTQKLASVFGEFGGNWHFVPSGGGSLDATISGNTFTAITYAASGERTASVTVKVCEGTVVGVTSDGFEFTGTRQ